MGSRHRRTTGEALVWMMVVALGGATAGARHQAPTLDLVLRRATAYVASYEEQLGSVIAEEDYRQVLNGQWQRRLRSELLMFRVPGEPARWIAFRDVLDVDGRPVEDRAERLLDLFGTGTAITPAMMRRLVTESTRYNLGAVRRTVNVPTFALQALRADERPRFTFERDGEQRLGGVETWVVSFEEIAGPTLIRNRRDEELFVTGRVWIDPEQGRVHQTEIRTFDPETKLETELRVTYQRAEALDLWVPVDMREEYTAPGPRVGDSLEITHMRIRATAEYSNFRRFGVSVDVDVAAPPP